MARQPNTTNSIGTETSLRGRPHSGLLERLDFEGDGHLVADDGAAGLERHVDVDAEVLAIQHDSGREPGDLAMAHAGVDAVELEVETDRLGDALEGEITVEHVVVAVLADGGRREGGRRVCLDVEDSRPDLKWASRCSLRVSIESTAISAVTEGVPSSPTTMAPLKVLKWPRTLLTMRWRTEKAIDE